MTPVIRRPFLRVPRLVLAIAIVLATVAAGVGVLSATAQEDAVIYGCVHDNSGGIRIVGGPSDCKNTEYALSWSVGGTASVEWDDLDVPEGIENQVALVVQCDGCVGSTDIEDFGVQTDDLASESVQTSKLQDGSVTTGKIFNGSVTADKLAPGAVTSGTIADGSVTSDDLGTGSVTTDEVLDGTIGEADLGNLSVTTGKIANHTITLDKMANGAVAGGDGGSIADHTITGHDVQDGALTGADIADGSVKSNDIDANYSVENFPSASSVGPSLTDVSQVTISIPSSQHAVMVFGDAVVRCSELGGCFGTLVWQVSGGLTSYDQRTLNVALLDGEELMVSVQQIVLLDSGSQELVLQMSYTGTGGALGLTPYELAAVDLGK